MKITATVAAMMLIGNCYSQAPVIQWQKCYGGTNGEKGLSIQQKINDSYYIGGTALSNDGEVSGNHSPGHFDYWVIEIDSAGNLLWQRCYGGTDEDYLASIELSDDGGIIVAGGASSHDGDVVGNHSQFTGDYWILKCDSMGNIQWKKCFGGSDDEIANEVIKCYDGDCLVIGFTLSNDQDVVGKHDSMSCPSCPDVWLTKIDTGGSLIWAKCYGGWWSDLGYKIIQTPDSGFLFAAAARSNDGDVSGIHGVQNAHGNFDYWIVKIGSSGIIQWQYCYGGTEIEIPNDIIQTKDSGYLIVGSATSVDFDVVGNHSLPPFTDAWIVKLDIMGNMQWQKCLGGMQSDNAEKALQLRDSSYLILCSTSSTDGDVVGNHSSASDIWLVDLDQSGDIQWQECLGGTANEEAYDLRTTNDSGLVLTGITFSNDGDVSGNHGDADLWVVKLKWLNTNIQSYKNSNSAFSVYYNNLNQAIINYNGIQNENIQIQIIDITGKIVFQQQLMMTKGNNKKDIEVSNLSAGIYIAQLISENGSIARKLVLK